MKKPAYQTAVERISLVICGVVAAGALLDAVSGAISLISSRLAAVATAVMIATFVFLNILLRRSPIRWVTKGGKEIRVKRLGPIFYFVSLGILGLLWVPAFMGGSTERGQRREAIESAQSALSTLAANTEEKMRWARRRLIGTGSEDYRKSYLDGLDVDTVESMIVDQVSPGTISSQFIVASLRRVRLLQNDTREFREGNGAATDSDIGRFEKDVYLPSLLEFLFMIEIEKKRLQGDIPPDIESVLYRCGFDLTRTPGAMRYEEACGDDMSVVHSRLPSDVQERMERLRDDYGM